MVLKREFKIPKDGNIEDYYKVEVELRVKNKEVCSNDRDISLNEIQSPNFAALSFVGDIKDVCFEGSHQIQTNFVCGQCHNKIWDFIHEIKYPEFVEDEILEDLEDLKKIIYFWHKYHLNDMKSGTVNQQTVINQYEQEHKTALRNYDEICNYLKEVNLYEDKGYRWGSAWLIELIPERELEEIEKTF